MYCSKIKECGKCGQVVPAGLITCINCIFLASGLPHPSGARAFLESQAEIYAGCGGLSAKHAMQLLTEHGYLKPKPKPKPSDECEAFPFEGSLKL